jgi:hypothetical protein
VAALFSWATRPALSHNTPGNAEQSNKDLNHVRRFKKEAGYPAKKPAEKPPIVVGTYESAGTKTRPPAAARYGVGATHLAQIRDATDQRRAHNSALSDPGRAGYEKQSPKS